MTTFVRAVAALQLATVIVVVGGAVSAIRRSNRDHAAAVDAELRSLLDAEASP